MTSTGTIIADRLPFIGEYLNCQDFGILLVEESAKDLVKVEFQEGWMDRLRQHFPFQVKDTSE